jgi:hypothetical protein
VVIGNETGRVHQGLVDGEVLLESNFALHVSIPRLSG